MMFAVALLLIVTTTSSGEVTESVLFHPIDQIHTSISSWILTTAIDFLPYHIALDRVYHYTYNVKISINQAFRDFQHEDPKYNQLLSMILNDLSSAPDQIHIIRTQVSDLIGHMNNNKNNRHERPLDGLFNFLFGTADQKDIDLLKQQVKELYENQVDQEEILNDIISAANISRWLIKQNIMKINDIIGTILSLNDANGNIEQQLVPLFTARRFIFPHLEFLIHHSRLQELIKQLQNDITLIRQYLDVHSTGILTPVLVDPHHLRKKLIKINKQLPTSLSLPEDLTTNICHYYKFLTMTPIFQDDKLIMIIRIPLIDLDSKMTIFKIYNLFIFNHDIDKSLKYKLEGNNPAVTKDQKNFAILSESSLLNALWLQDIFATLTMHCNMLIPAHGACQPCTLRMIN